jgi:hypothetical protein
MVRIDKHFWHIPFRQAMLTFGLFLIFLLCYKLFFESTAVGEYSRFPWILAASFLLIFGVFNALVFLMVPHVGKYWSQSIFSYAAFALLGGFTAMFVSGLPLAEAGSFRWIYLVITFSYLIFLSIGGFMKAIVRIAQKADTRNFDNKRYKHR